MNTPIELVSFPLCPFAQKVAIVLAEKGLCYETTLISKSAKPDWFLALSPLGRVPLLRFGDNSYFESQAIVEWLDEVFPNRLMPKEPEFRYKTRSLSEIISTLLMELSKIRQSDSKSLASQRFTEFCLLLKRLIKDFKGPYFLGEEFTAIDCAAAPLLLRLQWISELTPQLNAFCAVDDLSQWNTLLQARDSVKSSQNALGGFENYALYWNNSPIRSALSEVSCTL